MYIFSNWSGGSREAVWAKKLANLFIIRANGLLEKRNDFREISRGVRSRWPRRHIPNYHSSEDIVEKFNISFKHFQGKIQKDFRHLEISRPFSIRDSRTRISSLEALKKWNESEDFHLIEEIRVDKPLPLTVELLGISWVLFIGVACGKSQTLFFFIFSFFSFFLCSLRAVKKTVCDSFATLKSLELTFDVGEECLENENSEYFKRLERLRSIYFKIVKKDVLNILREIKDLYENIDNRWKNAIEELRKFVLTVDKHFPRDIFDIICSFMWDSHGFQPPIRPLIKQWPNPVKFNFYPF